MSTITPTVGRKVYFYAGPNQLEPHDATVIRVFGKTPSACVNLDVIDPDTAAHHLEASVCVGDDTTPGRHFRWMPYQLGQVAPRAQLAVETVHYADGTSATGTAPLPRTSPNGSSAVTLAVAP